MQWLKIRQVSFKAGLVLQSERVLEPLSQKIPHVPLPCKRRIANISVLIYVVNTKTKIEWI